MTTPHDPRRDRSPDRPDDLEERLRASLERHASRAFHGSGSQGPDAGMLAERILHAADRASAGGRPVRNRRIGWGPSLAAALVLLVIGGIVLVVTQLGSSGAPDTDAATAARTPSASPAPSSTRPAPQILPPVSASAAQNGPTPLHDVQLVDLTFNGVDSGWALGSADCVDGSGSRCTALLHTADGRTWQSRPGAQFNVPGVDGCAGPCVSHLRFATREVGYAYGSSAFFMTTDGGTSWVRQGSAGALALESLDGNVVRVTSAGSGCPGPCDVQVQTSAIGSSHWTSRTLGRPADAANYEVNLARGDSDVYLLFTGHVAGGGSNATSTLYRSDDDGLTWRAAGEPCPQTGGPDGEVDSRAVAAAPQGRVAVLCTTRLGQHSSVATSTDHGASFVRTAGSVPSATANLLTGDPQTVLVTAGTGLATSTDAGGSWTVSATVPGSITFVGFESPTVGRALGDGGRSIWTTRDGGRSWTQLPLP